MLTQLLHVRTYEHLAELDKVAVVLVIYLDDTPWVRASSYAATVSCPDFLIGADDGEGDLGLSGECRC